MRPATAVCLALVHLLLNGHAWAYCPKQFKDAAPGVEQTVWQPPTDQAVRVAFSNTLDAEQIDAIKAAFQLWATSDCSTLAFEFLDRTEQQFELADVSYAAPSTALAEIYVFWIDGDVEPPDFVSGFESTIAHTFPRHDRNGRLTSASIALNAANDSFPWAVLERDSNDVFDIQTVLTPLVGEVIGLATSDEVTGTLMTGGPIYSGMRRGPLPIDDQNALKRLYWDETCEESQRPPDPGADQDCSPPPDDAGSSTTADAGPDAAARCSSSSECVDGEICSVEGDCVLTGGDDDGCSCSTTDDPLRGIWILGIVVVLTARARRTRYRPH